MSYSSFTSTEIGYFIAVQAIFWKQISHLDGEIISRAQTGNGDVKKIQFDGLQPATKYVVVITAQVGDYTTQASYYYLYIKLKSNISFIIIKWEI